MTGLTVSVAVLFSLVVARLLTPLLAAYFLVPKPARPRAPLPAFYLRTLHWALDHRIIASLLGVLVFALSVYLAVAVVPKGLQPEPNPNYYEIDVDAPPGSTMADTQQVVSQLGYLLKRLTRDHACVHRRGRRGRRQQRPGRRRRWA